MHTATPQHIQPMLPSDRQLVDAVRRGSDAAWDELLARHRASLHALVRTRRERRLLESRLDELRFRVENGCDAYEGEPAVRSFRPLALAAMFGGTYGPTGGEEVDGAELLAVAFARLPEPWQTALWHRHVERLDDADIAPLVGRRVEDLSELIDNARRGLAHAFLVECEGVHPIVNDVEPLAVVIDQHLADALVPRLTGHSAGEHRNVLCRVKSRRRQRRV